MHLPDEPTGPDPGRDDLALVSSKKLTLTNVLVHSAQHIEPSLDDQCHQSTLVQLLGWWSKSIKDSLLEAI
jgi:hypothetical protein